MSVLEFISSVKWPITLLILVGFTSWQSKRNPGISETIKSFVMSRNFRLQAFGADVEATKAETTAAAAGELAARTDEELAQAAQPTTTGQPDVAQIRREAVEAVMTSAAQWGWAMAQMGFKNPPNPAIQWNADGQPEIGFASVVDLDRLGDRDRTLTHWLQRVDHARRGQGTSTPPEA
ncbi:hypothetical protein ACH47Z_18245 [Streptomyces sp. NPDC020192]|uniref:hypothetical protein n=1 Tax=Streptomyces sp. NPDC020192 TaxID=3365066 RepID=UPI0037B3E0F1